MEKEDFQGYLRWFVLWTGLLCIASVGLVAAMDPYRILGTPIIEGLNAIKPYPDRFQSEIKLSLAVGGRANVLILGNSRAEIGFDPENKVFAGDRAFNLAVPGAGIETAYAQLIQFIETRGAPKRIILGLDLIDFLVSDELSQPKAPEPVADSMRAVQWKFDSMFSMGALHDAAAMIPLQRDPFGPRLTERGANPLSDYPRIAKQAGYFALFRQRAQESAKLYEHLPKSLESKAGASPAVRMLRELLAASGHADIETDLIIYPLHAQMVLIMEEAGLRETTRLWKAMLVREIAAYSLPEGSRRIRLWDFSGFSGARCEPIPVAGDTTTVTEWYWEAGHFKRALGDVVLRAVVGDSAIDPVLSGNVLDASGLPSNELRIERERQECMRNQPLLAADVRTIVKAATSP